MHRERVQKILQIDHHPKKQNVKQVILDLAIAIATKRLLKKIYSNIAINVV